MEAQLKDEDAPEQALAVEFDTLHKNNVGALRKLNSVTFPVNYPVRHFHSYLLFLCSPSLLCSTRRSLSTLTQCNALPPALARSQKSSTLCSLSYS